MIGCHRWAQMSWREEAGHEDYEKPAHQWSQTYRAPAFPLITGGNTVGYVNRISRKQCSGSTGSTFFGLPHTLVRGMYTEPSIINKNSKKNLDFYCFVPSKVISRKSFIRNTGEKECFGSWPELNPNYSGSVDLDPDFEFGPKQPKNGSKKEKVTLSPLVRVGGFLWSLKVHFFQRCSN